MSKSSVALANLRGFVILIVLAFHSMLAYLAYGPTATPPFAEPPYRWQAFPITDRERWFGFDLFCAWHDVYLMSLMYFLSGLFVWASLTRKGSLAYTRDRLIRLAVPLCLAVYVLMPIATYPTYLATTGTPSVAGFWREWLALPFWACGPQWFLWQLLGLNLGAALIYRLAPGFGDRLAALVSSLASSPARFFAALAAASTLAYVPLAIAFTPWTWVQWGPFAVQLCRPLHYCVYFLAGIAVGAPRLDSGLLAADGALTRHWLAWLGVAFAGFLTWIIPMAVINETGEPGSLPIQIVTDIGFSLACASACLFVLAVVLRFATARHRLLDSLSQNAYGMYLIHYVFVVWLQYALLEWTLPAVVKAALVFGGTLLLSWSATAAMSSIPLGSRLIRAERRPVAEAS